MAKVDKEGGRAEAGNQAGSKKEGKDSPGRDNKAPDQSKGGGDGKGKSDGPASSGRTDRPGREGPSDKGDKSAKEAKKEQETRSTSVTKDRKDQDNSAETKSAQRQTESTNRTRGDAAKNQRQDSTTKQTDNQGTKPGQSRGTKGPDEALAKAKEAEEKRKQEVINKAIKIAKEYQNGKPTEDAVAKMGETDTTGRTGFVKGKNNNGTTRTIIINERANSIEQVTVDLNSKGQASGALITTDKKGHVTDVKTFGDPQTRSVEFAGKDVNSSGGEFVYDKPIIATRGVKTADQNSKNDQPSENAPSQHVSSPKAQVPEPERLPTVRREKEPTENKSQKSPTPIIPTQRPTVPTQSTQNPPRVNDMFWGKGGKAIELGAEMAKKAVKDLMKLPKGPKDALKYAGAVQTIATSFVITTVGIIQGFSPAQTPQEAQRMQESLEQVSKMSTIEGQFKAIGKELLKGKDATPAVEPQEQKSLNDKTLYDRNDAFEPVPSRSFDSYSDPHSSIGVGGSLNTSHQINRIKSLYD